MNTSWSLGCYGATSEHPNHSKEANRSTRTHSKGQWCCKHSSFLAYPPPKPWAVGWCNPQPTQLRDSPGEGRAASARTHWALLWHIVPGEQRDSIRKCFILFGCTFIRPGRCLTDPRGRSKKKTPAQTLVSIYQTPQQPEGQEHASTETAEVQSDTPMTRKTHAIAQM